MPTRATEGLRVVGRGTTLFAAGATADARIVGGIDSVREGLRVEGFEPRPRLEGEGRRFVSLGDGVWAARSPSLRPTRESLRQPAAGSAPSTSPANRANRVHPLVSGA